MTRGLTPEHHELILAWAVHDQPVIDHLARLLREMNYPEPLAGAIRLAAAARENGMTLEVLSS